MLDAGAGGIKKCRLRACCLEAAHRLAPKNAGGTTRVAKEGPELDVIVAGVGQGGQSQVVPRVEETKEKARLLTGGFKDLSRGELHKAGFLEAEKAIVGDDHVIVEGNVEDFTGCD